MDDLLNPGPTKMDDLLNPGPDEFEADEQNEGTLIEITDRVFLDADAAHREHLVTKSFPAHVALGEFYPAVRDALDAFVEAAIALDLAPPASDRPDTLEMLESSYADLMEDRDETCQGDPTLENLHDEITAVYLKAIFKLKRLS